MLTGWFKVVVPYKKSVLQGVIVVASVKWATGVIKLQAVNPINLLEAHRPNEALYAKTLPFYYICSRLQQTPS